jgi:dinuclear metal center YbgI/SA1388 family protein
LTVVLRDVIAEIERRYDPRWAEPWDAVGLVCGDPDAPVSRVHLAVDPVLAVADEAIAAGAQLLVTHHPLFLGGTTSVAATTAKGRVVHRLISAGVGLYVAHTNADIADPGVSDALAAAIGLRDVAPLDPRPGEATDKLVTFVPPDAADRVLDALAAAGAGTIGNYTRCAFLGEGAGTFRAESGAQPAIGSVGEVTRVAEVRLEVVVTRGQRDDAVRALLVAHPYDEPAYDVVERAATASGHGLGRGLGRVGDLAEAMSLADFTAHVAAALPATAAGVRAAGDPDRVVRRVAVCGGSGGDLAAIAERHGADVLVTSDLKHHATSEAVADTGVALVDAGHWATEWPWLRHLAGELATTVEATVSALVTDPWTVHRQKEL